MAVVQTCGAKRKKILKKQAIDDGMFEVVGLRGAFHMGKIQSGIAKGEKLAQGRRIEITVVSEIEAQVDGEPFIIPPSKIVVEHHNKAPVVINSLKDKFGRQQVRLTTSDSKVSRNDLERYRQELLGRLEDCQPKSTNYQDELSAIQSYIKRVHDPLSLLELLDDRISALTVQPTLPPKDITTKPKKKPMRPAPPRPGEEKKSLVQSAHVETSSPKIKPFSLSSSGAYPESSTELK